MKNIVGKRVRQARAGFDPKMTQAMLASKLQLADWDIDRAGVSKIEMGIRQVTDIELMKLAQVLEVTPLWLLAAEGGQTEQEILTQQIINLLAEKGSGFALIGQHYPVSMDEKTYVLDLLYYQRRLKALIAIEVQDSEFKPVYAEKMRFYLAALDETEQVPDENHPIGLTICHTKNQTTVHYTLKDMEQLGTYKHYAKLADLPDTFAPYLPSETEIQSRLSM